MPASIYFDVNRRAQVVETIDQIIINRQCIVTGLDIAAGVSDPEVILKARAVTGFPAIGSSYPVTGFDHVLLTRRKINSINVSTDTVDCDLEYRGATEADPIGGGIVFTITQGTEMNISDWYRLSGSGANIQTWYLAGHAADTTMPTTTPELKPIPTKTRKFLPHEVLKATGTCTAAQWIAVRTGIRAARGTINSDTWGGYTRGKWLFLGAVIRNLDSSGNTLACELTFLNNFPDWYAVEVHRDLDGSIPGDVMAENTLRAAGPPAVGAQIQRNGITLASIYDETAFTPLFSFTPIS